MKQLLLALFVVLMTACASESSKYEPAIKQAIHSRFGIRHNLKIDLLKLEHNSSIAVVDSLEVLKEEFRKEVMNTILNELNPKLAIAEMLLEQQQRMKPLVPADTLITHGQIAAIKHKIDSLTNAEFSAPAQYENIDGRTVLVEVIRCNYRVEAPDKGINVEESALFYMSPDGSKCLKIVPNK